jgi:hypothetical protein
LIVWETIVWAANCGVLKLFVLAPRSVAKRGEDKAEGPDGALGPLTRRPSAVGLSPLSRGEAQMSSLRPVIFTAARY